MAVPTAITDLSATAASNSPAGSDAVFTDLDNFLRAIQAFIRQGDTRAANVASASTADLGAAVGRFVNITGTTTITSFGTVAAGIWRIVTFAGALTLTHNATSLILPGGANITTAAGDSLIAESLGSGNWRVLFYQRGSALQDASFRNKLINGGFDIWQRATSQTATGYGSDDRWYNDQSGSTKTHSRQSFTVGQTDVPGNPAYFSRTVVTSVAGAGNRVQKFQRIEGVRTFAGKTVTLSFYAKADTAKNIAIECVQSFGTGGSPSADVTAIGSQLVALTTAWQRYTVTVAIPSISGKTLGTNGNDCLSVDFWFDAGSSYATRAASLGQQSGTFDIANVQLEEGSVATSFEQRPIGLELQLCRRYYEQSLASAAAPDDVSNYECGMWPLAAGGSFPVRYTVPKRSIPTIVQTFAPTTGNGGPGASGLVRDDTAGADVAVTGVYGAGINGHIFITAAPSAAGSRCIYHWTADAEL